MSNILIIIPAYNEAENIRRVVGNLINNYPQYDYIVVNDGSRDDTARICRENHYNLLDLPINLGLSGGVQAGFKYGYFNGYDYVVQFDGDGQHRPEYIKDLLEAMENDGVDIAIGSRFVDKPKPVTLRMAGSNIIEFFIRMTTGKKIKDPTSGMRMFNRKMMEAFVYNMNYGPEPDTVSYLIRKGASVKEVQVEMDERIAGESYLNLKLSVEYMFRMCMSILFIQWFRG
ncbi:MAG: glycosyltransferase family 2 protein [Ruminococcus sp.]|nr:glycosyltransferase family 2 protein [Ruminococcus sp.]